PYGGLLAGGLAAGETLLVSGATGNLGSSAVAVALAMGAGRVVAPGRNQAARGGHDRARVRPRDRRAKIIQLTPGGCDLRNRVMEHTTEHSPFARLDRESRLRLHALLREVVDGATPAGEAAQ
ncbi:hypothetical protein ABTY51_49300, partial [Streptomyces sp. NPDC094472]